MGLPELADGRLRVVAQLDTEIRKIYLKTPEPIIKSSQIHFARPRAERACSGEIVRFSEVRVLLEMTVRILGEPTRGGQQQVLALWRLGQEPFNRFQSKRHRFPHKVWIVIRGVDRTAASERFPCFLDHYRAPR